MENKYGLKDFILRKIAGNYIAVPIENAAKSIKGVIALNETAMFLWENKAKGSSSGELCALLCKEYDVSLDDARKAVELFIDMIIKEGISL